MALIPKKIDYILAEMRDTLQDQQASRWTQRELYRYLDQALRHIALATKYNKIKHTIKTGDVNTDTYTLPYEAIEFYSITPKEAETEAPQPHIILDANTIQFPENRDAEVVVEYYAFPKRIVYGVDSEMLLDEDLFDALKYYVLYRAYEKEASVENIQKAQYFMGQYQGILAMHLTRWHGKFEVISSRTAFLR